MQEEKEKEENVIEHGEKPNLEDAIPHPPPSPTTGEENTNAIPDTPTSPAETFVDPENSSSAQSSGGTKPNITIERRGGDVTITEVMEKSAPAIISSNPVRQRTLWRTFLEKINLRKKLREEKILNFMKERGKIVNDDVERLLHVSSATATRYCDSLEKQGKIRQVGKNSGAYYELI